MLPKDLDRARFRAVGSPPAGRARCTPGVPVAVRGHGIDFAGYREYQPGDDIRLVDWNVTARQNRPMLKLFEQEHATALMLVLDASPSMTGPHPDKWDAAAALAVLFAFVGRARRRADRPGRDRREGARLQPAARLRACHPARASHWSVRGRCRQRLDAPKRRARQRHPPRPARPADAGCRRRRVRLPRHALGRRGPRGGAAAHRRRPDNLQRLRARAAGGRPGAGPGRRNGRHAVGGQQLGAGPRRLRAALAGAAKRDPRAARRRRRGACRIRTDRPLIGQLASICRVRGAA